MKDYKLISKRIKTCKNNCIFCFIKQLPENLRPSLYVKDDDYLLSFMYGNFVTLTNVTERDLDKIIKYRLEPLYVSIHSLDKDIRRIIFNSKTNISGPENLKILDKNNIRTNIQIVLCPGINDGEDLEVTLLTLISDFKNILSIGIVPVGVTRFNKNPKIKPYTKENALNVINKINDFKKNHMSLKKSENIFLSDEFYILAGIDFPEYKYYGDFYQIDNGIGKSTVFLKDIDEEVKFDRFTDISGSDKRPILVVTSEYGKKIIDESLNIIIKKLKTAGKKIVSCVKVLEVENKFLGGNVKVTGLLSGQDIKSSLGEENIEEFDKILLPAGIFNEENFTIDGFNRKNIEEISSRIRIIPEDGHNFIREIIFN